MAILSQGEGKVHSANARIVQEELAKEGEKSWGATRLKKGCCTSRD
jgi:hypothetical protein